MAAPENVKAVFDDTFIIWVIFGRLFKWHIATNHGEKADSCSKNIGGNRGVAASTVGDLWAHETFGAKVLSTCITLLEIMSESEVGKFEFEIGSKEQILWFDVAMGNSILVTVFQTLN